MFKVILLSAAALFIIAGLYILKMVIDMPDKNNP